MNERIRELWIQCVRKHTADPMNWQNVADEYAELIVQECISKILRTGILEDIEHASDVIADSVREHFGVE